MANSKNLIPQNKRTKSEQRKIAKKGGIASGEARRRKKTLKEELLLLLETEDRQEKISLALLKEAENGSTKAFEVIRDTIGEKEPETLNIGKNSPVDELLKSIDEFKKKK